MITTRNINTLQPSTPRNGAGSGVEKVRVDASRFDKTSTMQRYSMRCNACASVGSVNGTMLVNRRQGKENPTSGKLALGAVVLFFGFRVAFAAALASAPAATASSSFD